MNLGYGPDAPYCWFPGPDPVTPEGLTFGNGSAGGSLKDQLDELCSSLLRKHAVSEARKARDPKAACDELHKFVESL